MSSASSGFLYLQLFFGFMYLSTLRVEKHSKNEVKIAVLFVILPRAIISLHYYRMYTAFAILPVIFIATARGWIKLTAKRIVELLALGAFLVVIPSALRGDFKSYSVNAASENLRMFSGNSRMFAGDWLLSGSSLIVFDKFHNTSMLGLCSPLFVSLSEDIIPYQKLGICTVPYAGTTRVGNSAGVATYIVDGDNPIRASSGSIYILDLYWLGGIIAVAVGSFVMGATCKFFVKSMGNRTIFCGIWAECLVRSLLAVRGTYGGIYQRIPSLLLATFLCVLVVSAALRGKSQNTSFIGARTVKHG